MKALLLAAGLGTRLAPFTHNHPKALAVVSGKTLLQRSVEYLQGAGIYEVVVNVHHFADQIEEAVSAGRGWGSHIQISDEREAVLETGGGLLKAAPLLPNGEDVVILNVDVFTDLDLRQLIAAHAAKGAAATLAVMKRTSSRYLLFDGRGRLCGWRNEKTGEMKMPRAGADAQPFAFSGIQVVSPEFIKGIRRQGKFGLVDAYLDAAPDQEILAYDHSGGLFLDLGKPEALVEAEGYLSMR
jgi:NDP-sugar pyrophosphorylase family protein